MSILQVPHAAPRAVIFDWHATLADTLDAMYHAVDDVLPKLAELDLVSELVKTEACKTVEDAKLVQFVRENAKLHPKIKSARKVSRTDIFEILFGENHQAKRLAHLEFDKCYRNHYGDVHPLEDGISQMLEEFRDLELKVGVLTNRKREFMEHELDAIDGTGWRHLFDTVVCGDDVEKRKPSPDLILKALDNLGMEPGTSCWYVGDSTTDVIAAKEAQVTAIFYNGAKWEREWIDKIFPGTVRHPHKPDAVIQNFTELTGLVNTYHQRTGT